MKTKMIIKDDYGNVIARIDCENIIDVKVYNDMYRVMYEKHNPINNLQFIIINMDDMKSESYDDGYNDGVADTESSMSAAYDEGYDDGRSEAERESFNEGYEKGFEEGYNSFFERLGVET